MKAEFHLQREQSHGLFLKQVKNPNTFFHFHSQLEIQMVDEGEVEVWVNDHHTMLKAGEISVALGFDAHGYHSSKDCKVTIMIIPGDLLGELWGEIHKKRSGTPFIRNAEIYQQLRECAKAIKETKNQIKKQGYLFVILGTLMEQMELQDRESSMNSQLSSRMLFYINEHFREDLSLQTIAADLGYNPSYLSRYFRAAFNIGINQYITMIRLREAILLLREGKNSVSYCAFESGFNSIRTFYRAFYEEFHCTPKEYLERTKISEFQK